MSDDISTNSDNAMPLRWPSLVPFEQVAAHRRRQHDEHMPVRSPHTKGLMPGLFWIGNLAQRHAAANRSAGHHHKRCEADLASDFDAPDSCFTDANARHATAGSAGRLAHPGDQTVADESAQPEPHEHS